MNLVTAQFSPCLIKKSGFQASLFMPLVLILLAVRKFMLAKESQSISNLPRTSQLRQRDGDKYKARVTRRLRSRTKSRVDNP